MSRLLHSSKATAVFLAIIGLVVLVALGKLSVDQFSILLTALIATLTGAIAWEDSAAKRASGQAVSVRPPPHDTRPSPPPETPTIRFPRDPKVPTDLELPSPRAHLKDPDDAA